MSDFAAMATVPTMNRRAALAVLLLFAGMAGTVNLACAQQAPAIAPPLAEQPATLRISASFPNDQKDVPAGLIWRVLQERAEPDGSHKLVAESDVATPVFQLPSGNYVVHVAFGLAGAAKRVSLEEGAKRIDKIVLNAGGIKVVGSLADADIPGNKLSLSVFVPDGNNPEGKIVARNLRGNETVRLPEGTYHVVSTYLDMTGLGSTANASDAPLSNSVVTADVRVQPGKVTVATLRHRAAQITLKLVNNPGAEALANTSFTILTPGGDVLRELIGAYPSLVLAEGEYVTIARRDGRTYQNTFRVDSGGDRDVEILAQNK